MEKMILYDSRSMHSVMIIAWFLIYHSAIVRSDSSSEESDESTGSICQFKNQYDDVTFCYWFINDSIAEEALKICQEDGGTLAVIPDDNILTQILQHDGAQNIQLFYIGYLWLNGTKPSNETCNAVNASEGTIVHTNCTIKIGALCSWSYNDTAATTFEAQDYSVSTPSGITTPTTSCSCKYVVNLSGLHMSKEMIEMLDQLKANNTVDKKSLSSSRRRRESADDPRPSAAYTGYAGVAVFVFIGFCIIAFDFPKLFIICKIVAKHLKPCR